MEKGMFSIKYRILLWIFILLFPLVVLLGFNLILQAQETTDRLYESEETNLHLSISFVRQEADNIEEYLYDLALQNRAFRAMAGKSSDVQLYSNAYEVFQTSENLFHSQKDLTFFLLYSAENEYYAARDNGLEYMPLREQMQLRNSVEKRFFRFFLADNSHQREWFTLEIANRWFLCRTVRYQELYCAALFDLTVLAGELSGEIRDDSYLVFRDGNTLLSPLTEELEQEDWTQNTVRNTSGRKYVVISEELCGIELSYLVPHEGAIAGSAGASFFLMLFVALMLIVGFPVLYFRLTRDFFAPLDNLVETMKRIRDGSRDSVAEERAGCREFREVNLIFNQMLAQIHRLKIEKYEKEQEKQQAQMAFYHAQIRPHFYLNCLKVLYSLAEQRAYVNIENCILLVSNHLRYAFRLHDSSVPLREELSLCENYVKLCGAMAEQTPQILMDIESSLMDAQIPPISILSFIENSIRMNLTPQNELKISIRAKRMLTEEGAVLCISVHDNGVGFDEEHLQMLNGTSWLKKDDSHVGLQNVVRRFRLLYGSDFSIAFYNQGGAMIEMFIPAEQKERKEDTNEAVDFG